MPELNQPKNSAALISFALGIVTLMLTPIAPLLGLISGVSAVILGRRGLLLAQPPAEDRRNLAIAGITIGALGFLMSLALLLFPLVQPAIPLT